METSSPSIYKDVHGLAHSEGKLGYPKYSNIMPQAVVAKTTFGAIVVETKLIFFITKVYENWKLVI